MKVDSLVNLDFYVLDLQEIRCSKKFYYDLMNRCGISVVDKNKMMYKGIPVVIDDSIQVLDECNLVYKKLNKEFYEVIKDNLKNEIEELNKKINIHREKGDFGTYKNLILAYKEVLGLYKEMIEGSKEGMTICNMSNTFEIDKDGNIEIIANKVLNQINAQFNKTGITIR